MKIIGFLGKFFKGKKSGKRTQRPIAERKKAGRPSIITENLLKEVKELKKGGVSNREIARRLHVSEMTVRRALTK